MHGSVWGNFRYFSSRSRSSIWRSSNDCLDRISPPPTSSPTIDAPSISPAPTSEHVKHVVVVSVDGLRADRAQEITNMASMTCTYNARTDKDYTLTLPNHVSMWTGIPVLSYEGITGHGFTKNDVSSSDRVDSSVTTVFDVVSEAGMTAAVFGSKSKIRDLIDNSEFPVLKNEYQSVTDRAVASFEDYVVSEPLPNFVHIHMDLLDNIGHADGWGSSRYTSGIRDVDWYLNRILVSLKAKVGSEFTIIVTSDHGGSGKSHSDEEYISNYRIPFCVSGQGVSDGDLYINNLSTKVDPGMCLRSETECIIAKEINSLLSFGFPPTNRYGAAGLRKHYSAANTEWRCCVFGCFFARCILA